MTNQSYGYVSVIALSLIEPIMRLIENLEAFDPIEPNEVQTGSSENGYSCGVIVLSVLLLESAINRTRYVNDGSIDRAISSSQYFGDLVSKGDLAERIEEVFTIRDAIVHNHLRIANIDWVKNQGMIFTSEPKLLEGSGNKRFRRNLNLDTRQSNYLGLNLFPSRIWRKDAYLVLRVVYEALMSLEKIDRSYFYLSPQYFKFNNDLLPIEKIINSLPLIE